METNRVESNKLEAMKTSENDTPKDFGSLLFKDMTNVPKATMRPARKRLHLAMSQNDSEEKTSDLSVMEDSRGGKELQSLHKKPRQSDPEATQKRVPFSKALSFDRVHIEKTLARSSSFVNLIGDSSRSHCLPLVEGRFPDTRISADTLSKLLEGGFSDQVALFQVVDCRFPYEYEGGHITNAVNLFNEKLLIERLFSEEIAEVGWQPNIVVFHCEFSQKRGPALLALLRKHDRLMSARMCVYPELQYPEIYLLDGGYKNFFLQYPGLCNPSSYRAMLDLNYVDECRSLMSTVRGESKKRSRRLF